MYGLRHSFYTYMRTSQKITTSEIMDLIGHTDFKVTDNYTHSNREIGDKVIEMWAGLDEYTDNKNIEAQCELTI